MGLCQCTVNHDIFKNTCKCYLCCLRPPNHEELFNLHHASARNIVECVFGILKRHYWILLLPTEFPIDVQGRISAALCALHNFIAIHTPDLASDDISESDLNTDSDLSDEAKDCYGFSSSCNTLVTLTRSTFPSTIQPVHFFLSLLVQLRIARRSHAYSLVFPIPS